MGPTGSAGHGRGFQAIRSDQVPWQQRPPANSPEGPQQRPWEKGTPAQNCPRSQRAHSADA
eukprot:5698128-Pyramimonas_sp.AAC.1